MVREKECSVEITRFSKKGHGIGHADGLTKAIEIPKVFPGEKVTARIFRSKLGVHQGDLLFVEKEHPLRVEPRCKEAFRCGGCSWQALDYKEQLKIKKEKIANLFQGLVDPSSILPVCELDSPWSYRNKMEFTFYQTREGEKYLGLIQTGTKGRVIDISRCELCPEWMSRALDTVRAWWKGSDIEAYHRLKQTGNLHLLTLREGARTNEKMVILTVCGDPSSNFNAAELKNFKEAILETIPDVTSIFLVIKTIKKGSSTSQSEMLIYGKDHIEEKMIIPFPGDEKKELYFKISPSSFFQPCTRQAEKMLGLALSFCTKQPLGKVLDLYCGTATFGMVFSYFSKKVVGLELNPYAVFDAQVNIERNKIQGLEVIASDVKDMLSHSLDINSCDLVIVDPPRAGLGPKATSDILNCNPQSILYVSCNPFTQVEDLKILLSKGYEIEIVAPVDQFAHSPHLENIVLLKKMPLSS